VDYQRLVHIRGYLDVVTQGCFLGIAWREVAIEVEPGLSDGSHQVGHRFDLGPLLGPGRCLMRVKTGSGHDTITELLGQAQ